MIKSDLQNITASICLTWQYLGTSRRWANLSLNETREEKIHIILDVILQQGSWTVQFSVTSTLLDFSGGSGKSLMGSELGHRAAHGWGGLGRAAVPSQRRQCFPSRQIKAQQKVCDLWDGPRPGLSPLLSTFMTLSKLLSFSEFFPSSGKWDKEWQFLVNRLTVKLSSWWNGVRNTTWYAFSPSSY